MDKLNNQPSKLDLGIDIDGVITASPEFFASLSNQRRQEGGRVHIVSSRSDNLETRRATLNELGALGIVFDQLYLLPSIEIAQKCCPLSSLNWYQKYLWQKIDYCIKHGIGHFYDDDAKVVELFQMIAPEIRIIHYADGTNSA